MDVWNLADDHGPILLFRRKSVNWVADEQDRCQVCKLRALCNLFPILDLVVRDEEGREFLERGHVVKPLDLVVREIELLKSCCDIFQVLNSLDVITSEGKNFQILQALHGHDLLDRVRGKRKLLAILKLIDLVVQSLEWVG